jgi:hypothetical protein
MSPRLPRGKLGPSQQLLYCTVPGCPEPMLMCVLPVRCMMHTAVLQVCLPLGAMMALWVCVTA